MMRSRASEAQAHHACGTTSQALGSSPGPISPRHRGSQSSRAEPSARQHNYYLFVPSIRAQLTDGVATGPVSLVPVKPIITLPLPAPSPTSCRCVGIHTSGPIHSKNQVNPCSCPHPGTFSPCLPSSLESAFCRPQALWPLQPPSPGLLLAAFLFKAAFSPETTLTPSSIAIPGRWWFHTLPAPSRGPWSSACPSCGRVPQPFVHPRMPSHCAPCPPFQRSSRSRRALCGPACLSAPASKRSLATGH